MTRQTGARRIALLVAIALLASACAPVGRGVGSQPAETVLTFANWGDNPGELQAFAAAVERLSSSSMRIEITNMVHRDRVDTEPAIIDDVVAGRYDMAWVAQRPWPARGVHAFDALVAPLLVDSYPLEAAVLGDPIVDDMLAGLDGTGVVGLGIVPGPIRYAAMRDEPLVAADALKGRTVAIDDTAVAEDATRTLGGTPQRIQLGGAIGDADAVVQQLGAIYGNRYDQQLPNVSGLGLWPRPLIVVIGKPRYDTLSGDQRAWLDEGISAAVTDRLGDLPEEDSTAISRLCENRATIASPDAAQRAAFEQAVRPVYDRLAADPLTARALARISELKSGLPPPPALPTCDIAAKPTPAGSAGVGFPDGTYEAKASCDELQAFWAAHDTPADKRIPCPIVLGFTLEDGRWTENYGERWTFSFFGDHVKLGDFTLRWTYDGQQVTFSDIQGGNPDDASVWTLKPFARIGDPAQPVAGIPEGRYAADVSVEEQQAAWDRFAVPLDQREVCPCHYEFTYKDGVATATDGYKFDFSVVGDHMTVDDGRFQMTVRWAFDPQTRELTLSEPHGGAPGDHTVFCTKPFVKLD